MTIYKLLEEDVTALTAESGCTIPRIEIRGSCQFISWLKANLHETLGVPVIITIAGRCTEVRVYGIATFMLTPDDTILTGYTAKLL